MESQHTKIIKMLRKNNKYGLPNYKFPEARILKYSSRISELRQDGHNIIAEREWINGRATGVFRYFLIEEQTKQSLLDKLKIKLA